MARTPPTKAKTPTKVSIDPFAEFEDWLKDGPATRVQRWPNSWNERNKALSKRQERIVADNVKLLLDRERWKAKADAFEAAIASLKTDTEKLAKSAKYEIVFMRHNFSVRAGGWDFSNYQFPCSVSFDSTVFEEGDVSFLGAVFKGGEVWFGKIEFGSGDIFFDKAKFDADHVWFCETAFGTGDVSFNDAIFNNTEIWFDDANFGKGHFWFDPKILGSSTFSAKNTVTEGNLAIKAAFPSRADFRRLKVSETADFSGSTFAELPDFRDAKFDRAPEVANMQVPKPKMVWSTENTHGKRVVRPPFRLASDPEAAAKYRKLKAMALAANDHEKDGEFFAYEMLAKRGVETTNWFGLAFNSLYYWLSNFGQSYGRPILWMAVSFIGFAVHYWCEVSPMLTGAKRFWFAAELSLRNSIPFIGSLVRFAPSPEDHVTGFQASYDKLEAVPATVDGLIYAGIVQSFISAVLLFLLLLALRNKFRLK